MKFLREFCCNCTVHFFCVMLVFFLGAMPLSAKIVVDFDPNVDFSKYKTFAFIGCVENLPTMEVNPDLINDSIHHAIIRELTKKGLREVQPGQNPDLVVRYWADSSQQIDVTVVGNWAPYGPYIGSYWGWIFNSVSASGAHDGSLILDLIDSRSKELIWRLYLIRKIANPDKDWKKADEELIKAFQSYPPSDKEKEEKNKERAEHPPKPAQP